MADSRRIGIFGAGWVGLVTGGCFAELGHEVIVRDVVPARIDALRNGEVPFHEPELSEVLERNRVRLHYTLDVDDVTSADILFICVQTPPTYSGDADLSYVWNALDELPRVERRQILVMKSTVPVGTGDKVRAALEARGLTNVGYVSNPEFLAEGGAVRDFLNPDRIVIGAFDRDDAAVVESLYAGLDAPVVRTDVASAEMIKLAANAFLMTRISFINEIANVCEAVGADVVEVAQGVGLDHRLGPHFLRAGIGYGGSCLTGDETVLVRSGGTTRLVELERLYAETDDDDELEIFAWDPATRSGRFAGVACLTRREIDGEIVELKTKMGRRLRCTTDHPLITQDGVKLGRDVTNDDWLPIASLRSRDEARPIDLAEAVAEGGVADGGVVWHRRGIHRRGIETAARRLPSSTAVAVASRTWSGTFPLTGSVHVQRVPDAIWTAPFEHKRALLAGLWRGDGSWSFVNGGPSVVLEYGTVSPELADGLLRLLADVGVIASLRVGRSAKSTRDTYWLRISGADQVERLLDFVRPADRPTIRAALAGVKRIAPTGYRRDGETAWARVVETVRKPFRGAVYSVEVPRLHTFVTTGGVAVHNCFPKDSLALKQLASNSGYHFQLLSAVIEVNELQKRRVISKLQKHLGRLRGKKVALLGLAFKAGTDDMREAPSIVLASRLLAEGAEVRAWDPVAKPGELLKGAQMCDTVLDAVRGADAAVIVTEWDELRGLASSEVRDAMARPLIVDGRNLLDPDATRAAGFAYEGIGRPSSPFASLPEVAEPEPRIPQP